MRSSTVGARCAPDGRVRVVGREPEPVEQPDDPLTGRRTGRFLGGVAGGQPCAPGLSDRPGVGARVTVTLGEPLRERRRQGHVLLGGPTTGGRGSGGTPGTGQGVPRGRATPTPFRRPVLLEHQPGGDEHAQVVARRVGVPTDGGDEVADAGRRGRRAPGDDLQQAPA